MRNIALTVAYDGTDYCGWQKQKQTQEHSQKGREQHTEQKTIQETIEDALEKMQSKRAPAEHIHLTGSGRTDSGVHAAGQVANFYSNIESIAAENYRLALNSLLPQDIRIMASEEVPENFHARFSAKMRTYKYFFITGRNAYPTESRFALPLFYEPDITVLNEYCKCFLGEKDFALFTKAGDRSKSTCRFVRACGFHYEEGRFGKQLVFEVSANAFLWNMVRSMTGTVLYYEKLHTSISDFESMFKDSADTKRDLRKKAGPTLSPQGLFLWKIEF
ncbi:MAG: tRNA pseudouridine(38-40) synthase TruA [Spirochaetaceae bacterium]|jgi:tRNA pseudouridine38-40 synthase|nr:tRNA pseudouridine(38-40) synthase TruA [Spirochaetaceae bacterium]